VPVGRDEDVCLWVCEQRLEPSRQIFLSCGIAELDKERADRPQVADLGRANRKRHNNCILTALRDRLALTNSMTDEIALGWASVRQCHRRGDA
jgi:hypothetical protein